MLAGDDLAADVEAAERVLQTERTEVERERSALDTERSVLERTLHGTSDERAKLTGSIGAAAQRLFELVSSQRSGIAVVEARDGHCSLCNVRLRPQMFNQILQGTELIQCESCMRILYHDPNGGGARSTAPGPSR